MQTELQTAVFQATLERRRKVLVLSETVRRYDQVEVFEVLGPKRTGEWFLARVTWVDYVAGAYVASIDVVTRTLKSMLIPATDRPTRPDAPRSIAADIEAVEIDFEGDVD